jgi:hypothetical protein
MDSLKLAGCGSRFLHALGESLKHMFNQLEEYLITNSQGVKQGGPTSCPLFTFFINDTITAVNLSDNDHFLKDLHSLLSMDDTAILAESLWKVN